jgi:hypothetical protein
VFAFQQQIFFCPFLRVQLLSLVRGKNKSKPLENRKEIEHMKMNALPADTAELLVLAEDIAALLDEKREVLDLSIDLEALLRASIAAAAFAINTYLAALADRKSPDAQRHLPEAKRRCDQSIKQLRRRVSRTILQLRRYLKDQELKSVTRYDVARSR